MSDAPQIRIVLADDHALVLEGLRALLSAEPDLRVVATATVQKSSFCGKNTFTIYLFSATPFWGLNRDF